MQRDEKNLEASVESLLARVHEIKNTIALFIIKLEQEHDHLSWPSVLNSYALITSQLSSLSKMLQDERTPQFRNYVLLPLALSQEADMDLLKSTGARVNSFTHDLVPHYLRTKPEPEIEEKINQHAQRASQYSNDSIQKQISAMSKISANMVELITNTRDEWENEISQKHTQPQTSSRSDTEGLVAAISFGAGLKKIEPPPQSSAQTTISNTPATTSNSLQMGKAPSLIKTNIKSATNMHPYHRS